MTAIGRHFKVVWDSRTWKAMVYLLAGIVLGLLWFTWSLTMYVTGAALVIIWVGIPILVITQWSMRGIGAVERQHINQLLSAHVDSPEPVPSLGENDVPAGAWAAAVLWGKRRLRDAHAWRVFGWTLFRGVMGPVGFCLGLAALVVPLAVFAAAVLYTLVDLGAMSIASSDAASTTRQAWWGDWMYFAYPVAILLTVPAAWLVRGVAAIHVPVARWALGPCASVRVERATARAELAEERVRIDQELHDSIGHMITMTVIQAGAGAHVFDSDPEFARQALRNIEQRGRAAMGELDRIIAAIRGDEPESRSPLPGIADLPALIGGSQEAGMTVDAVIDVPEVSGAIGRAAFAVVREAVTNAAKHAPGAPVSVTVTTDDDAVAIRVVNAASGVDAEGPGGRRGVAGMRDRVGLLGGVSRIGATADGGFEVLALLPLGASLAPAREPTSPWSALRETVGP